MDYGEQAGVLGENCCEKGSERNELRGAGFQEGSRVVSESSNRGSYWPRPRGLEPFRSMVVWGGETSSQRRVRFQDRRGKHLGRD